MVALGSQAFLQARNSTVNLKLELKEATDSTPRDNKPLYNCGSMQNPICLYDNEIMPNQKKLTTTHQASSKSQTQALGPKPVPNQKGTVALTSGPCRRPPHIHDVIPV